MFDNLKKKLKGLLGKAGETVEPKPVEQPPVPLAEESKPPEPLSEVSETLSRGSLAPLETQAQIEKELLEEVQKELEEEEKATPSAIVEPPTKAEEEIEEKVEEALQQPFEEEKLPATEEKSFAEKVKGAILGKFEEKIEEPRAEDFEESVASELKEEVSPSNPLSEEKVPEAETKIGEVPAEIEEPEVKITVEDEELADEQAETAIVDVEKPPVVETKPQAKIKPPEHKPKEAIVELEEEIEEKKEGGILKLFSKITHKELTEKDVAPVLWELEIALLENDVAKDVTEKIIQEVKDALLSKKAKRGSVEEIIKSALKKAVNDVLGKDAPDLLKLIEKKKEKPFVVLFFGFNGTGKTMTIGKFAKMLAENGYKVAMAAGDTFRAAAIEQLEVHATNLKVPIIKQKKGADSAAVIFDAIKHAKAHNIDVVLADTAGRSHTNANLMDELRKIVRVSKPDFKIFVGDSLTGNDAAEQAKLFSDAVGIDGSVLTKIDTDPKGGACLSVAYMTKQPILYLGNGQNYGDLIEFSAKWFVDKVF